MNYVVFPCGTEDDKIIHVWGTIGYVIPKHVLHELLEHHWGTLDPKRHSQELKPSTMTNESCLTDVGLNHGDLVIPLGEVDLRDVCCFTHAFQHLLHPRHVEGGLSGCVIDCLKIDTQACRSVRLSHSNHGRRPCLTDSLMNSFCKNQSISRSMLSLSAAGVLYALWNMGSWSPASIPKLTRVVRPGSIVKVSLNFDSKLLTFCACLCSSSSPDTDTSANLSRMLSSKVSGSNTDVTLPTLGLSGFLRYRFMSWTCTEGSVLSPVSIPYNIGLFSLRP